MKLVMAFTLILLLQVGVQAQQLVAQAKVVSVLVSLSQQVIGYSWGIADSSTYEAAKRSNSCKFTKEEKSKAKNALLVRTCWNGTINVFFVSSDSNVCISPCTYEGSTFDWNDEARWAPDASNYRLVNSEILAAFGTFTGPSGIATPAAANITFRTWPTSYQDFNFPILMGGTFGVVLGQN